MTSKRIEALVEAANDFATKAERAVFGSHGNSFLPGQIQDFNKALFVLKEALDAIKTDSTEDGGYMADNDRDRLAKEFANKTTKVVKDVATPDGVLNPGLYFGYIAGWNGCVKQFNKLKGER